jgi:hypothetical protein
VSDSEEIDASVRNVDDTVQSSLRGIHKYFNTRTHNVLSTGESFAG